mmetsp:Transcript_2770/g.3952  ORF Transcript_2770/g.3952 Transcript_2770/m.3952 type:complete len:98 (+) Transcript_2770:331-624(+)
MRLNCARLNRLCTQQIDMIEDHKVEENLDTKTTGMIGETREMKMTNMIDHEEGGQNTKKNDTMGHEEEVKDTKTTDMIDSEEVAQNTKMTDMIDHEE